MGKIDRVLDEVAIYFGTTRFNGYALAAQPLEPSTRTPYTPEADNRLVRMMSEAKYWSKSELARVKRVVDELPRGVLRVLRYAQLGLRDEIGCALPSAIALAHAKGLDRSVAEARERAKIDAELDAFYWRTRRVMPPPKPFDLYLTVSRRAEELEWRVIGAAPTPADARVSAKLAIRSGEIDVRAEVDAVIEAACDVYLDMRERLDGTRRAHKAKLRQEAAESFDDMMGKKRRKARERFERTHCGELLAHRDEIIAAIERLDLAEAS